MILTGRKYHVKMIPAGLIIPFNSVSIPSGWERFTAMDGKHPIGAGNTYAVAGSGGVAPLEISKQSTNTGAHTGTGITMVLDGGPDALSYSSKGTGSEGNHIHTLTADYDRLYQQLLLIKATEKHRSYPANAIVLSKESTTPLAGVSICYNANKILKSGASITNGGGLTNEACSTNGSHIHNHGTLQTAGVNDLPKNIVSGNHTHAKTISLTDEELKRAYLTAWTKSSGFGNVSRMIAMWEGTEAPEGWHLCDGTDGYIDLRDYFIILSDTGNAGNTHNETNRVEVTITLTQNTWSHYHNGSNAPDTYPAGISGSHQSENQTHNHTIATSWVNYTPIYYALTFVQKI